MHHLPPTFSPSSRHREPSSFWLTWHFLHFSSSSPRHLAQRFLPQSSPPRCNSDECQPNKAKTAAAGFKTHVNRARFLAERPQPAGSTHIHLRGAVASAAPGIGTLYVPRDLGSKPYRCLPWVHTPIQTFQGQSKRGGQQAQGHLRPTRSACKTPAGLPVLQLPVFSRPCKTLPTKLSISPPHSPPRAMGPLLVWVRVGVGWPSGKESSIYLPLPRFP